MWLLHDILDRSPGLTEDPEALRYQGVALRYSTLRELSLRSANGLARLGVRRGDRLVVILQNRPEVAEIALACSRLGAVFVPLSPALKPRQLLHVLCDSGATALLVSGTALSQIIPVCTTDGVQVRNIVFVDAPEIRQPVHERLCLVSMDDLRDVPPRCEPSGTIDQDLAAIMYTSGSTGRSKGVMLSHRNLVSGAAIVAEYLDNRPSDRILAALPLSFDYGFSQITTALHIGATAILTNYSTPAALIQEAASERITGLAGVPTMWAHLAANRFPDCLQSSLRYLTNSGGALHPSLIGLLRTKLPNTLVYCMYGLTEAFRSTFLSPSELDSRPGSIGKALQNQEVAVLRADGSQCAPGEVGELVHRGSLVSLGYWRDPEETSSRFRAVTPNLAHGSVRELAVWSGDLARTDDDGYLYFVARADQMIKTSGHRVSPTEIEEVVCEVDGVIEAVAFGVPDMLVGQRILVAITTDVESTDKLADAVRRHCRMQLPLYMTPSELRIVRSIPRNANGKPDRGRLLELLGTGSPETAALWISDSP